MGERQKSGPNPWQPDKPGSNLRNSGSQPVVGQSKPYVDGSNAHGKHEKRTRNDTTAGDTAASGPSQDHGWPARSPSKKY